MAKLFRIAYHLKGNEWLDKKGRRLCDADVLRKEVNIPSNICKIDVVAHNQPSQDRFKGVVVEDGSGMYVDVTVEVGCMGRESVVSFYTFYRSEADRINHNDLIHEALLKCWLKAGDKIYVQIEY